MRAHDDSPPLIDRRVLLGGAAAAPTVTAQWPARPETIPGGSWLTLDAMARAMMARWSRLEAEACQQSDWFGLTEAQRTGTSFGKRMAKIDEQLAVLFDRREEELRRLTTSQARNLGDVEIKLAVTLRLVRDEDSQTANLIAGLLADVSRLAMR